jgi:hypothetical protein
MRHQIDPRCFPELYYGERARLEEQERIIKLLESKPSPCSDYCIKLIKGEKK